MPREPKNIPVGGPVRFLGFGRGRECAKYHPQLRPGEEIVEVGCEVYAVIAAEFFCQECDGIGCTACRFSGRLRRAPEQPEG